MKAVCKGCKSGPRRSPAVVSIDFPAQVSAKVTHETRGTPSINTVQVPHVPCQQPPFTDKSPTDSRRVSSRLLPLSTKAATSSPFRMNWIGVFIDPSCSGAEEQAAQVNRQDLAPPPRAGDGIVGRRRAVGGDRERGSDSGGVERAAFEGALRGLGPHRRRRHAPIGDAGTGNAP